MVLAYEQIPVDEHDSAAVPVVMVHGFTQNAACLRGFGTAVIAALATEGIPARATLVDAPGHGASEHDQADLIDAARLLVEAGGRGHYIGYSMGGRMLLHAALLFPERFDSLTLIGATAGIEDGNERAARAVADEQLAERLESEGLASFLDYWLDLPLFSSLPESSSCRAERLTNRPAGLAASLRSCGTGNQYPLWDRLPAIDVAVQVIAGTGDAKFTALGRRMVADLPNARFDPVEGGHAVHSERPNEVARLVASFIAAVRRGAP